MTRTEIKSASSLSRFLSPQESRSTRRALGEPLDVVCALAMGSALPSTEDGAAQDFARVRLVRAFPSLSFGGKEKTIAVWHSR